MRTSIWKFPFHVDDHVSIRMPIASRILHCDVQNGTLCLWAAVDISADYTTRNLRVVGTGHPLDGIGVDRHVGSVMQGPFVWHIFDMGEEL